jgi:transposase-like protein
MGSKRLKIKPTDSIPIDMFNWYENKKKREQEELEKKRLETKQEEARINNIKCPVCKSSDKIHHIKRQSNGIYGPGHSSWVTENYLICKSCGVHYSDVSKIV